MSRTNLLEYEIRRRLIEFLLGRVERENINAEFQLANIFNSSYLDRTPVPEEEVEKDLKQLYKNKIELEKTIFLFKNELKGLNSGKMRKLIDAYNPLIVKEKENQIVKRLVDEWLKSNKDKKKEAAYFEIGDMLEKKAENVKRLYNYKPKK